MRFVKRLTACALLALALAMAGCGREDAETEIRGLIGELAEAAEAGEIGPFRRAIADDYTDLRGNDRQQLVNVARGMLLRAGGKLLVFPDTEQVELITDSLAEATVRVRFADADLTRFALDTAVYRFVVTFARDGGDWQIASARWAPGDAEPR